MAASSWDSEPPMAAWSWDSGWGEAGGEPQRKRGRAAGGEPSGGAGVLMEKGSASTPAAALPPAPASGSFVPVGVTVEDTDALDCGVCYLPLKPPIFQCDVGHVVCSSCRDKLMATGKCHVCGVATGSYRRCHAMERLVESARVPCPHAAHGCTAWPAYHDREAHGRECAHEPWHCPGEACGFVGSTAKLLEHFGAAHGWPCTTASCAKYAMPSIRLRDSFNFMLADCHGTNETDGGGDKCLLLLNVVRQTDGNRVISVLWMDPHAGEGGGDQGPVTKGMEWNVSCSWPVPSSNRPRGGNLLWRHYQRCGCSAHGWCFPTDLSNGLPSLDGCFQFVVPNSAERDEKDGLRVEVSISIINYL